MSIAVAAAMIYVLVLWVVIELWDEARRLPARQITIPHGDKAFLVAVVVVGAVLLCVLFYNIAELNFLKKIK